MGHFLRSGFLVLGLNFLGACSVTRSGDLATAGFYAVLTIHASPADSELLCSARFYAGSSAIGSQVELSTGDEVTCSLGNQTQTLAAEGIAALGNLSYEATGLPIDLDGAYSMTFKRASTAETFTASFVLPDTVVVTAPAAGGSHNHASDLPVRWTASSAAGSLIELNFTAGGTSLTRAAISDNGTYDWASAELTSTSLSYPVTGTFVVSRTIDGTHPAGLNGYSRATIETSQVLTLQ